MSNVCDGWQIVQYASNQLSANERAVVESHLKHCAECRAFLHECQTLQTAVKNRAQTRVKQLPALNLSQFKEKRKMITTRTLPKQTHPIYIPLFGLFILIVAAIALFSWRPFSNGFIYQGATPTIAPTYTLVPSATPTATLSLYTGYRGKINMRFKLRLDLGSDKAPSEDWQIYLWNNQTTGQLRGELFRTCKDQPVVQHNAETQAMLDQLGVRAPFGGPTFERCLKPYTMEVREGEKIKGIVREGYPFSYDENSTKDKFTPIGMLLVPTDMRFATEDMGYQRLFAQMRTATYESPREIGTEIVAGRRTVMFEFTSPPAQKPLPAATVEEVKRILWVDLETHLIMGAEGFDSNGVSILAWAFTEFELNPKFAPDLFTIASPYQQPTATPTGNP